MILHSLKFELGFNDLEFRIFDSLNGKVATVLNLVFRLFSFSIPKSQTKYFSVK